MVLFFKKSLAERAGWRHIISSGGVDALPLAVFVVYMTVANPTSPMQWRAPYYLATALALGITTLRWRAGETFNRIHFAITLYFISGSFGLAVGWTWLNQWYGRLEGSAMLWWTLVVGAAFSLFSKTGFAGIENITRLRVRKASCVLLVIALGAALASTYFRGNRLLSIYLPFVTLFVCYSLVRARLELRQSLMK